MQGDLLQDGPLNGEEEVRCERRADAHAVQDM